MAHKQLGQWTPFSFLIGTLLLLGIYFRFAHLDRKIFWVDEVFSLLRISGYSYYEVDRTLHRWQAFSFADLQQYLGPNPDRGLMDVVRGLMQEDPHMPLFYFVTMRIWTNWTNGIFVSSLDAVRMFSVVLGILCLPAMYWLCWELFRSRLVAGLGAVIIAVSPIHVLNSQLARFYSLWTLVILVSSALLLRAYRQPSVTKWSIYAGIAAIGLYSHLFYTLTLLPHGIYVWVLERLRWTGKFRGYLFAAMFAVATFIPWFLILWVGIGKSASKVDMVFASVRFSPVSLVSMWIGNVSRLILDVGLGSSSSFRDVVPFLPVILAVTLLILYALYFVWRSTPHPVRFFLLTLIATPFTLYLLSDMIIGGRLSGLPRYAIPSMIGIQIALAYTFAAKLSPEPSQQFSPIASQLTVRSARQVILWKFLLIVVLSSGIFSCAVSSPAVIWWHTDPQHASATPAFAAWVNQFDRPLVLVDRNIDNGIIDLSMIGDQLKPEASLQLVEETKIPTIAPEYEHIFLYYPSKILQQQLKTKGTLQHFPGAAAPLYRFQRN